jgi:hypothetical protein
MRCIAPYCILAFFTFSSTFFVAQNFEEGFEKYNPKRLGPYSTYWHEFLIGSSITMDLDYKTRTLGNFSPGINYGFGVGYLIKIGIDDMPQSIGIGLKTEYYPNAFYKFNVQLDAKILAMGTQTKYISLVGGGEFNVSFDIPFERREFHTIIYLLDATLGNLEIKWGLQSWNDRFDTGNPYFDYTFNTFRFTYIIRK